MTDHLARHHFEQYVADDPSALLAPALRVHVGGCDRCGTRKRALEAAKAHFLATHPASEFSRAVVARATAEQPAATRPWAWWSPRGVFVLTFEVLAVATAVWSWFAYQPRAQNALRHSGVTLQAIARHAGQTHIVRDGDALTPGDELVLEYTLDRPRHALVLGIDARGAITRYFPAPGQSDALLAAAEHAELPIDITFEPSSREERVVALFAEAELDEIAARSALVRALAAARATRGGGIPTLEDVDLPADQQTFWFRKP